MTQEQITRLKEKLELLRQRIGDDAIVINTQKLPLSCKWKTETLNVARLSGWISTLSDRPTSVNTFKKEWTDVMIICNEVWKRLHAGKK